MVDRKVCIPRALSIAALFVVTGLGCLSCTKSPEAPIVATRVALLTPASNAVAGTVLSVQPVVVLLDAAGNKALTSGTSVSVSVSSGATLIGGATASTSAGVAAFAALGLNGSVGSYTLTYSSGALTSATQVISLSAGAASQVVLTTPAAGAASGAAFTTQPQLAIRDASGNTVTTDNSTVVTMAVSTGGTVVGTATKTAASGVVTFGGVGISGVAGTSYTVTYSATGLTAATQSIIPTAGAPSLLTLTSNAAGAAAGVPFTTQPSLTFKDAQGNVVTSVSSAVTLSASTGGVLVGSGSATAVNGVVTFSGA